MCFLYCILLDHHYYALHNLCDFRTADGTARSSLLEEVQCPQWAPSDLVSNLTWLIIGSYLIKILSSQIFWVELWRGCACWWADRVQCWHQRHRILPRQQRVELWLSPFYHPGKRQVGELIYSTKIWKIIIPIINSCVLPDFGDDPTGKHLDEPGVLTAVLGHARRLSIQWHHHHRTHSGTFILL